MSDKPTDSRGRTNHRTPAPEPIHRAVPDTEPATDNRLRAAARRDQAAHARDDAARARDEAAAADDVVMAQLDDAHDDRGRPVTGAEIVMRAAEQRRRAAKQRARAAKHRERAAADRRAAAADREQAAQDRRRARADREALALLLEIAETDAVTGARTRSAGLRQLDRELERCRRIGCHMTVVYVDVVGLKALNDSAGHEAGDELLARTVATISDHVRPYDLVIRLGGDEFLCAMIDIAGDDARERFADIAVALAGDGRRPPIRTGFAELTPDDTAPELIARADRELLLARD